MIKHIPNLLLIIATATAALSASSSRRPWRALDFQPNESYEEYLAFDVTLGDDLIAKKNSHLNQELTSRLDALGFRTVRVRNPATPVVTVALSQAKGEVLAQAVTLPGQEEILPKGRIVDAALRDRAASAGVELQSFEGKLIEPARLPKQLRAAAFLDEEKLQELSSAGVLEVPVKRAAAFTWRDWSGRWAFLLSILVMAAAVTWKRRLAGGGVAVAESGSSMDVMREHLRSLSEGARDLHHRAPGMTADELHAEVDGLLGGPAYAFVESRATLQRGAGMGAFALVMDPFSRGERQLSRAWSASVDQHAEEAVASIGKAAPLLQEAFEAFPS